jgi:electron transport complex protein RnfG
MIMRYVQGPAVSSVLREADNGKDLINSLRQVTINGTELTVFIGMKDGGIWAIAYESEAEGFGGTMGVMTGYELQNDRLTGIGITTHKETPGIGSRTTEELFTKRFAGKPVNADFKLKQNGGEIDALTGASVSSGAVSAAVQKNVAVYPTIKKLLTKQQ